MLKQSDAATGNTIEADPIGSRLRIAVRREKIVSAL
jgi:hypothetical protein